MNISNYTPGPRDVETIKQLARESSLEPQGVHGLALTLGLKILKEGLGAHTKLLDTIYDMQKLRSQLLGNKSAMKIIQRIDDVCESLESVRMSLDVLDGESEEEHVGFLMRPYQQVYWQAHRGWKR